MIRIQAVVLAAALVSVGPAGAATLKIACSGLGQELALCKSAAQAWAGKTGHEVEVVSTPSDSSERLAMYQQVLAAGSDQLDTAQNVFQLLKTLAWFLPLLTLAAFGLAVWLARDRRRAVRGIGAVLVAVALVGLVAGRLTRNYIVDSLVTRRDDREAAGDAWDIFTALLRDGALTLAGLGLALLVAVWVAGPSRYAADAREWLAPHIARAELAFGGAAALLVLLVWWGPTAQTHRWQFVLVVGALLALGVEVLRRQTAKEFPNPQPKGAPNVHHGPD